MNPLRERRLIPDPPRLNLAYHDGSVVVDSHVHANNIVSRELGDRVLCCDREDESRLAVLNFNDRQSDFPLSEPLVVEVEDQTVPLALDDHFQDDLAVRKWVILNGRILPVYSSKIYIILTIRRRGPIYSTFPSLRNILGTLTARGFNSLLIGAA